MRHSGDGAIAALFLCFLLLSCDSGGGIEPEASSPCESIVPRRISAEDAVEAGKRDAAYIIQDGEVRRTSVQWMSFGQALRAMGAGPNFSGWGGGSCVWLVTLDGFFYAPGPGSDPRDAPGSPGPVCGRIGVAITPDTGGYLHLTFQEIEDCG